MKIYTRTGDDGSTGLFGGGRVSKDEMRVQAYGTVDELNSVLGMVRAQGAGELDGVLERLQAMLFVLGAELATNPSKARPKGAGVDQVSDDDVAWMESGIDHIASKLPKLKSFILPSGGPAGAALHFARAVCRRAERVVVALAHRDEVRAEALCFLNRLSDLLFMLARAANAAEGHEETPWLPPKKKR
jgi:cob(I)alamin adenosyltransferase